MLTQYHLITNFVIHCITSDNYLTRSTTNNQHCPQSTGYRRSNSYTMQLNVLIADVELEFISIILQTVSGTDSIIDQIPIGYNKTQSARNVASKKKKDVNHSWLCKLIIMSDFFVLITD